MSNKASILDYWVMPEHKPRDTQVQVLEWIESQPDHIKYFLVEVPVGGGKSPLALTMSAWLSGRNGSSVVLTPQKILQKQYEASFDKSLIGSMYGKANYQCASKQTNCEIGMSVKPKCIDCPYKNNFNAAKMKPNIVLNYKIALLYSLIGVEFITQRKLMVFDECHTLEHHLTEFLAVSVSERMCKKHKVIWMKPNTMEDALDFIKVQFIPALANSIKELNPIVDAIFDKMEFGHAITVKEAEIVKEYDDNLKLVERLESLVLTPILELKDEYVFMPDKTYFKFKELYGRRVFKSLVEPCADKFLFMSSTILDKDEYCKDLGIDPAQAAFISMPSEFDVNNRSVMYSPTMKMTYGWDGNDKKDEREEMLEKIRYLCDQYKSDSGVIHTGSFNVAKWLIDNLQGTVPHKIMHHQPESEEGRDAVIAQFSDLSNSQPKLLISPSVTEGLDLKGDLARFNLIVKTPYPFLGDAWVKARMEASPAWYTRQAMIAVIQAGGRVVRNTDDWGDTYILDSAFWSLYSRMGRKIPAWWRDGFIKQ
jgi:Type III restriction enzyme, res subunit.